MQLEEGQRITIADDPGAGKTIMAGLILKELQYRHLARRVLIVAPGHPLLEAVNETILSDFAHSSDGYSAFGDPEGVRQGAFWFVEGEVMDGTGQPVGRRVFCLYQDARTGEIQHVNPAVHCPGRSVQGCGTTNR